MYIFHTSSLLSQEYKKNKTDYSVFITSLIVPSQVVLLFKLLIFFSLRKNNAQRKKNNDLCISKSETGVMVFSSEKKKVHSVVFRILVWFIKGITHWSYWLEPLNRGEREWGKAQQLLCTALPLASLLWMSSSRIAKEILWLLSSKQNIIFHF